MGFANTALVIAVQTSVPLQPARRRDREHDVLPNIGGTIGVGVMGVVVAHDLSANAVAREAGGAELVARILGPDRKSVARRPRRVSGNLQQGIAHVTWICVGLGLIAVIAAWVFPKSRNTSGVRLVVSPTPVRGDSQ